VEQYTHPSAKWQTGGLKKRNNDKPYTTALVLEGASWPIHAFTGSQDVPWWLAR
jgi:hypothetical protein